MSARILIVEDEMIVALSLRAILQDLGYESAGIAADLPGATTIVGRTAVDLALVDLNLRDGLTGPAIGERLCASGAAVLFVTANPRVLGEGIAGTIGVLTKPTDRAAIESAVAYALRVKRGEEVGDPPAVLKLFNRAA